MASLEYVRRPLRWQNHPTGNLDKSFPFSEYFGRPTQKPALEIHLDNRRSATATVGRMSNVTDAPITSALRYCTSSLGDKVTDGRDMLNPQRKEDAREGKSSQHCTWRQKEATTQSSPIFFVPVSEDKNEKEQSRETLRNRRKGKAVMREAKGRLRYGG